MLNGSEVAFREVSCSPQQTMIHERVAAGLEELGAELAAGKSEKLFRYLKFLGRFHKYSLRNCLLIFQAKEDATFVAGFRRWQELQRQVKKGERSIAILAPVRRPVAHTKRRAEGDQLSGVIAGFRTVRVFDVSQTEGEPLPGLRKETGDATQLLPAWERIMQAAGISLRYERLPWGINGWTDGTTITIRSGLPPAEQFCVMVHEFAHCKLGHTTCPLIEPVRVRETEAESVACVVANAVGIQAVEPSCDYIHLWEGSSELLARSLSVITHVAGEMIAALDAELGNPPIKEREM